MISNRIICFQNSCKLPSLKFELVLNLNSFSIQSIRIGNPYLRILHYAFEIFCLDALLFAVSFFKKIICKKSVVFFYTLEKEKKIISLERYFFTMINSIIKSKIHF